ncbi:MAG: 50S ribosomal protein L9 [Candidatus Altimarinota bacterium]
MYVILTKDVPGVGQKNHLLKVRRGYFMNYLQPRSLAEAASAQRIESLKELIIAQKEAATQAAQAVQESAKALEGITIVLSGKTSAKGTLFKALGEKDVIAALKKQAGVEVAKGSVEMEPLKKIGDHVVQVQMGDQQVEVKVKLEAKEEE